MREQRNDVILKLLREHRYMRLVDLMKETGASISTLRRDVSELEKEGKLRRVHGGVQLNSNPIGEESFMIRLERNSDVKYEIAKNAIPYIQNAMSIFIDSGSTTYQLISQLSNFKNIQVYTNGIEHCRLLTELGVDTILLGGELKNNTQTVVGAYCLRQLDKLNFDLGIFGCYGFDDFSATTIEMNEGLIREKAFIRSTTRIILAEEKKRGRVSSYSFTGRGLQYSIVTESTIYER